MMAMRTTLNIDDEALLEVRKYAGECSISLSEAATRLIFRGVVNQPKFQLEKGWALLTSSPGSLPLTNERLKRLDEEAMDEELGHALSTGR